MRIRWLKIERFRGIESLEFIPGPRTVLLGPNNAGKSTVLEALDLLLHPGLGRPRPSPTEIDYFRRAPADEFSVAAVIGDLPPDFRAEVRDYLEGWDASVEEVRSEPDGGDIEPVVRVRVRGTSDFDLLHEFSKEEAGGARFGPRHRAQVGWVFDGRTRDPVRQLSFYQGGLLERLFAGADLNPALGTLKQALGEGATSVNADDAVATVLQRLADDLRPVGLLGENELPRFEVGSVSARELLQALRLALPSVSTQIPVSRQGRGAQRLLLAAILLRLAQTDGRPVIGAFEEPEEALEPLRQTQVSRMLAQLADGGGQIFVVTHSPEIARAFTLDDLVLLDERTTGAEPRVLRRTLSIPVRQKYERWLDRGVVRALFTRNPFLVEGPGDRAVAETFWRALASPPDREVEDEKAVVPIRPPEQLGVDLVNCEGAPEMPMMARLLAEAGKNVAAWVELDRPDVLAKLRDDENCGALVLHDQADDRQTLEKALAQAASLPALCRALRELAESRGYSWSEQRTNLVSSSEAIAKEKREVMKDADSLEQIFAALDETEARCLVARVLATKTVSPFEMKGARQGRLVAEAIVDTDGVPEPFERALRELVNWIEEGCQAGVEIHMSA